MTAPILKPKNAATLLILKNISGEPFILMGRRHDAHKFMPGYYVFPGGKMDRCDYHAQFHAPLHPSDIELLSSEKSNFSDRHANALALCAIRETQEETGLLIGSTAHRKPNKSLLPAWKAFHEKDLLPNPSSLHYFARAITPTGHVKRFDTRFFLTLAENVSNIDEIHTSNELLDLQWVNLFSPPSINILDITKQILQDTKDCITPNLALKHCHPVTLYYSAKGRHYRKVRFNR